MTIKSEYWFICVFLVMCLAEVCTRTDFKGWSRPGQQNCVQSRVGSYIL